MISDYAEALQKWLESRFAVNVPIVDRAPSGQPAIVVNGNVTGDIYQGGTSDDRLGLVNFTHPQTKKPLQIALTYSIHEESGIVDSWYTAVEGALDSERDSLLAVLRPTEQLRRMFNDNMTPRNTFNGAPFKV